MTSCGVSESRERSADVMTVMSASGAICWSHRGNEPRTLQARPPPTSLGLACRRGEEGHDWMEDIVRAAFKRSFNLRRIYTCIYQIRKDFEEVYAVENCTFVAGATARRLLCELCRDGICGLGLHRERRRRTRWDAL